MFDFHKITITDFRSYKGTHVFEFPTKPGLYFLTGDNQVEPDLGANGAGKSTLLDAITWVLYGYTTRGLKAGEVLTWESDQPCWVELELTVGPDRLIVYRGQKPNHLYLDSNPVDQTYLESRLRLNYDSFLYSVINTQFGKPFLSHSPAVKLNIFSELKNLNFWLQRSNDAEIKSKSITESLQDLSHIIARDTVAVATHKSDIEELKKNSASFKKTQLEKINGAKQSLTFTVNKAISLEEKISKLTAFNRSKLDKHERFIDYMLEDINSKARQRAELVGQVKALKVQKAEYKQMEGNTCPKCKQPVHVDHIRGHLKQIEHKIACFELEIVCIEEEVENSKKHLIETKLKKEKLIDEMNEIKDKESEIKALDRLIVDLKAKIKEYREQVNPFEHFITERMQRLNRLEKSIATDTKTKEQGEADLAATSFWIKGFRRIRLFIIEEAFRTLELEINNCLAQLGMVDWQISFDVERENKSGGLTKGFITLIKSPANKQLVRWENWSGGETQRLQLAGDLGLANMIMHQQGLRNTIEFYDEPSTHLSAKGMTDLADMLHERAISEGKRIWIVDHSAITNFGEFQGVITVRKDSNGSRIEYSAL